MPLTQKYFNRFELKYQISLEERDRIIKNMNPFMKLDPYVKNKYDYEVRSVYFDSPFGKAFVEKVDGIKIRVKFRIRYYPNSHGKDDLAYIELKKKINENVAKSRIAVPLDDAFQIIKSETSKAQDFYENASAGDKKTLENIWYLYKRYHFRPVCVVSYKRQPYMGRIEKRFRITFDTSLQVRNYNFDLRVGGGSDFILPKGMCVMEIKFNNFIPHWAINIVQLNNCIQQKLSKFANGLEKTRTYTVV